MDVYARLGVRPIVNARGMNTMASGSLMPKPVLDAMTEAAGAFVDMGELNAHAGAHIARLVGVEGAHVTSGSAGGLLLAAAACIAGATPSASFASPTRRGCGTRSSSSGATGSSTTRRSAWPARSLVEVGTADACTPEAIEAAIGPRTAALIYIVSPGLADARRRPRAHGRDRPRARPPADRRRRVDPPAGRAHHALDGDGRRPRDPERRQGHPGAAEHGPRSSAAPT